MSVPYLFEVDFEEPMSGFLDAKSTRLRFLPYFGIYFLMID
jgi:hypothetical protein